MNLLPRLDGGVLAAHVPYTEGTRKALGFVLLKGEAGKSLWVQDNLFYTGSPWSAKATW